MTRNRTVSDLFSALATELLVLLLLTLAACLAISRYMLVARERVKRVEMQVRRRALRRPAV
jgi:hypothetical protein